VSLLSRYAECLFWLARYTERAASLARIIETHAAFDRGREMGSTWIWLVKLYADDERFAETGGDPNLRNVVNFYVRDFKNGGSILSSVRSARENARALRAILPTEMWVQLNSFCNRIFALGEADIDLVRLSRTCALIRDGSYAQIGIADSTLYRDMDWVFYSIGLMVERADQTSRLLDVKFAQIQTADRDISASVDATYWGLLLRSANAYQAFRRLEQRGADANRVAKFLIVNPNHPRSIAFCIGNCTRELIKLKNEFGLKQSTDALAILDMMSRQIKAAVADPCLAQQLHQFNDNLQRHLIDLTQELGIAFFGSASPAAPSTSSSSQSQS
jgi:uncharacterized alpha-E superfamily protein